MRKFRFEKLVRDKIPDAQRKEGSQVDTRRLKDDEYLRALQEKLLEESQEIDTTDPKEALKELADLQEVIDCMVEALGSTSQEVAKLQITKRAKAGSFRDRQYIEAVSVDNKNPWIRHYTANPKRYPEIKDKS